MSIKTIYLTTAIIIISTLLGVGLYFNFSQKDKTDNVIFVLAENKKDIIWIEDLNLSPDLEAQYKHRLQEAEQNLNAEGKLSEESKEAIQAHYNNVALFNSYLGNYQKSYDYYLKSLELYPDDRVVWLNLGSLLIKMQAFESAEKAIDEGLRWNPWDSLGWTKKIELYEVWLGNTLDGFQKINEVYKEAIRETNNNTLLLSNYADWLARAGHKDEAIKMYQKLIELIPENEEAINRKINKLK